MNKTIKIVIISGLILGMLEAFPKFSLCVLIICGVIYLIRRATKNLEGQILNNKMKKMTDEELDECRALYQKITDLGNDFRKLKEDIEDNEKVSNTIYKYTLYYRDYQISRANCKYSKLFLMMEIDLYNLFRRLGFMIMLNKEETVILAFMDHCIGSCSSYPIYQYFALDYYKGNNRLSISRFEHLIAKNKPLKGLFLLGNILKSSDTLFAERYYNLLSRYATLLTEDGNGDIPEEKRAVLQEVENEGKDSWSENGLICKSLGK
ncbi:MAG: hypothetical protein LKG25_09430 [Prevotella sp.]|jgi:hypothetical protein|nr:hypothetical protein [Prevotella sp.]MCI1282794.1 hypothetical protein [Prevotella sp.]